MKSLLEMSLPTYLSCYVFSSGRKTTNDTAWNWLHRNAYFWKINVSRRFAVSKAPKDDAGYVSTNISIIVVQNKNDKLLSKSSLKEACVFVNEAYMKIKDLSSGDFIRSCKSNSIIERYIATMLAGKHELLFEDGSYKPFKNY